MITTYTRTDGTARVGVRDLARIRLGGGEDGRAAAAAAAATGYWV